MKTLATIDNVKEGQKVIVWLPRVWCEVPNNSYIVRALSHIKKVYRRDGVVKGIDIGTIKYKYKGKYRLIYEGHMQTYPNKETGKFDSLFIITRK